MSNQRAGKWKSATLRDGGGMQQVNFFKYAKEVLESEGHEDAFSILNRWKHGCVRVNHYHKIHVQSHTH